MKKLLFIILLMTSGFMFGQYKHKFSTVFPERTSWTIQGKCLYANYADSENGRFKKVIKQRFESPTRTVVWIIEYPKARITYTVRVNGDYTVVTKTRT